MDLDLPSQRVPFPVKPDLHSHVYEPAVFMHVALVWHVPLIAHSSTSIEQFKRIARLMYQKIRYAKVMAISSEELPPQRESRP